MQGGFVDSIDWKTAAGWITLSQADMEGIARAVAQHVQGCYSRERVIAGQVALIPDDLMLLDQFDPAMVWAE
jgi:hypothetical protein